MATVDQHALISEMAAALELVATQDWTCKYCGNILCAQECPVGGALEKAKAYLWSDPKIAVLREDTTYHVRFRHGHRDDEDRFMPDTKWIDGGEVIS